MSAIRDFFRRHNAVPANDAGPQWSQASDEALLGWCERQCSAWDASPDARGHLLPTLAALRRETWVRSQRAARLLPSRKPGRRLHVVSLWRWVRSGKLEGWRVGGCLFVSRAEVLACATLVRTTPELTSRRKRLQEIATAEAYLDSRGVR